MEEILKALNQAKLDSIGTKRTGEYRIGLAKAESIVRDYQEAKIVEGMKMDEKQANKGVCKDCYYAGSFTCEH